MRSLVRSLVHSARASQCLVYFWARYALAHTMSLASALSSLFLAVTVTFGPHPVPQGELVWSNQTRGAPIASSAQRLPNGDVVMVVPRIDDSNPYVNSVSVLCLSHVTGLARWETPLTAQQSGQLQPAAPYVQLLVGPRHGSSSTATDDDDGLVVLVLYGDGMLSNPASYMALDAGGGAIILPGRQYPLQSSRDYAVQFGGGVLVIAAVAFAGGDASLDYSYTLRATAIAIPSGRELAVQNVTTSPPFRLCYAITQEVACIEAGCGWFTDPMMPPGKQQTCEQTIWGGAAIAVATPPAARAGADAAQSPDPGPLAIIGSRPTTAGDITLGSVTAVRLADSTIAWRIEKTTAYSISVDTDVGVVIIGEVCPYPCSFRNWTTIRGHSLVDGGLLWERISTVGPVSAAAQTVQSPHGVPPARGRNIRRASSAATTGSGAAETWLGLDSVTNNWDMGPAVGPRACEVVCGLPCNLIATSNITRNRNFLNAGSAFFGGSVLGAVDPRTGLTVASIPTVPGVYDTAGGVWYTVDSTGYGVSLVATSCADADNGTVVWSVLLPPDLGIGTWQRVVAAAPGPEVAAAVVFTGGSHCKSQPTPRGCNAGTEAGGAALHAPPN